ncbi:MAG: aminotransferase class I/II-fold pyridoxal phosphate-dependent enzyme [Planctomycetota bacterium]|nr:aminotransferase class I/II-fold pyridoxal phosphate-dependent enzyme [Planctomycetota bacterium]
MSKNFRRTGGLRIGWCVAPDDAATAMVNLQSHYTSGPATPTQVTALAAIARPYRGGLRDELQKKRDLLRKEAEPMPHVKIWPTPATFYSFWDVRPCFGKTTPGGMPIASSDDVAEYLCTSSGVIAASGTGFMQDGYLRLSFATPDEDIVAGMRAARDALGKLR